MNEYHLVFISDSSFACFFILFKVDAVVHLDTTVDSNYDHINNKTVISYSKLQKI